MPEIHDHDIEWLDGKLYGLPSAHKNAILALYKKRPTRREANLSVLQLTKSIAQILGKDSHFYSINIEDKDHRANAKKHARRCIKIAANEHRQGLLKTYNAVVHYMRCYQIIPPKLPDTILTNLKDDTLTELEHAKVRGVLLRTNDESWWKPKLRKLHNRQIETISRMLNLVSKHKGIYASDITVSGFKKQWQSNQQLLEQTIATNEDGFSMSLAELSKLNVSNPAIRFAELMVRLRGFEDYAKEMGYSSVFLTMTTPSKYHRNFAKSGDENPNWNGATPLDGQDYLNRTFQRIRAALKRDNITPFGFRIAEPHHDGTPHWHLIYFIPTEQQQTLVDTFEQYCLEEDGDEHGAKKHRFKVMHMDPKKGSATGYVVKYISKNINGKGIEHDSYGKEAVTSAERIRVWASCWGIRQFQQIGGVGVTQWRELRRLPPQTDQSLDEFEAIRQAADNSDWNEYTSLMGGVFCKRNDQTVRPLYLQKRNRQPAHQQHTNFREAQIEPRDAEHHDPAIAPNTNPEIAESCSTTKIDSKAAPILSNPETCPVTSTEHETTTNEPVSKLASTCIEEESTYQEQQESACSLKRESVSKEYKTNRYGDELMTQLKGLIYLGVEIITRHHEWTLTLTHQPNAVNLESCQ
ncbi:hypothetical protein GCM10007978_07410 [Shewanella hanedai]|uniref:Replication endonuclease n=1 Tax=Shewanella hanedai TaxID=25 RepID=A0A553JT29_SHEHA|nr:replication endonuclease [Shewanella hanedai]TRY15617.1 replication endonuclease [Shewanella hanedai]GGI72010.1 hypothetical protein GCM10007978_07410 [Shewanella hanedai]